jgi:hypothetical protein
LDKVPGGCFGEKMVLARKEGLPAKRDAEPVNLYGAIVGD